MISRLKSIMFSLLLMLLTLTISSNISKTYAQTYFAPGPYTEYGVEVPFGRTTQILFPFPLTDLAEDCETEHVSLICTDVYIEIEDIDDPNIIYYYTYNCHFYSFFLGNPNRYDHYIFGNDYLYEINGNLLLNNFYEETNRYNAEIIAYYTNNDLRHTGIVQEAFQTSQIGSSDPSSFVYVKSKWGYEGLYEHNGYLCSYTNYDVQNLEHTMTVKFFRYKGPASNPHNHTSSYTNLNDGRHRKVCIDNEYCNLNIITPHNDISYTSINSISHRKVCACGEVMLTENHGPNSYSYLTSSTHKVSCLKCGYYMRSESHNWVRFKDYFTCICGARANYIPIIHDGKGIKDDNLKDDETIIYYEGKWYLLKIVDNSYEEV